jgi:RNA polymerase sigma factor (sigma-70 family)
MSDQGTELGGARKDFPPTTANFQAQLRDPATLARMAVMETLATRYWKPVYHFLRMTYNKPNEDAKDLAQAFFVWMLERDLLLRFDPSRSSFRTFLKGVLRNFAGNEHQALHRLKRGGGAGHVSIDVAAAALERGDTDTDPEKMFDRLWLKEVLHRAVDRVKAKYQATKRLIPFVVFQQYDLDLSDSPPSYAEVAKRLGIKESDVRNHLHEVREKVREEVKAEISSAEGETGDLSPELSKLFRS